jgi:hypothetical protein
MINENTGLAELANKLNVSDCAIGNTNKTTLELATTIVTSLCGEVNATEKIDTDSVTRQAYETLNQFNGKVVFSLAQAKSIVSSILDVCFVSERSYVKIWEVVSTVVKHSAKELEKENEDFVMSEGIHMEVVGIISELIKNQKDIPYNAPAYLKVYAATSNLSPETDEVKAALEQWSFSGHTTSTIRNLVLLVQKVRYESHELLKARTLILESRMSRDILLKLIFNEDNAKAIEEHYGK